MSDKEIYQVIADELKNNNIDAALWTQAKEVAGGDPDKTEAGYIRLRFLDIVKSKNPPSGVISPVSTPVRVPKPAIRDDELSRIRAELAKKLAAQQKHSLYSTLKLQPDASDTVIAAAIDDLEIGSPAGNGVNPAEFNYAKNTLRDPALREQYDRQLLESISYQGARPYRSVAGELAHEHSWWESRKTSVVIGVLSIVLFGYLGLGYLKTQSSTKLLKEAIDTQKEATHSATDIEKMRTEADIKYKNDALRAQEDRQNQELALRARATDQMLEQQRRAQENQRLAEEQRQKIQQEQAENQRINREKQYWACMNLQMSQRDANSFDASARCSMYR